VSFYSGNEYGLATRFLELTGEGVLVATAEGGFDDWVESLRQGVLHGLHRGAKSFGVLFRNQDRQIQDGETADQSLNSGKDAVSVVHVGMKTFLDIDYRSNCIVTGDAHAGIMQ
jgi:hypothetical protein